VKAWLSRERVPFTAYNVDEELRAYDELIARGFRTVPVTVIGERIVKGFDEAALREAIEALPVADPGSTTDEN
jgi:glutaredoxin